MLLVVHILPKLVASQRLYCKESTMQDAQEIYYGMFTEDGNACVHGIVTVCRSANLSWAVAYQALGELAKTSKFAEATDTMVREMVYDAIGADGPFYI